MSKVIINGVTKALRIGTTNVYEYDFPLVHITVFADARNEMQIDPVARFAQSRVEKFDDIPDKLGASNIEEYADALANGGYFFRPSNGGGGIAQDLTYIAPNLSLTGSAVDIDVTQFPFLATSLSPALSNIGLDSLGNASTIPIFNDETDRDTQIPTPVDGQLCYLLNNTIQERYYDVFGLWLDAQMTVGIIDTPIVAKRIVEVEGAFPALNYDGNTKEFPLLRYPANTTQQDRTLGATMQIGKAIDVARSFACVRTKGQAYIEYGEAFAAGELVVARISGVNADIGLINGSPSGSSGSMGIAISNSGSNPLEPLAVLVNIGLITETF